MSAKLDISKTHPPRTFAEVLYGYPHTRLQSCITGFKRIERELDNLLLSKIPNDDNDFFFQEKNPYYI
jgi:hypothetical protein